MQYVKETGMKQGSLFAATAALFLSACTSQAPREAAPASASTFTSDRISVIQVVGADVEETAAEGAAAKAFPAASWFAQVVNKVPTNLSIKSTLTAA